MAVQPARIASGDLRHIPVTPRLGPLRPGRRAAAAQSSVRSLAVVADRPATRAVRLVAPTPWAGVDVRFRSRIRPAAIVLGAIIVFTMLGLVYVTQVLAAQGARYEVDTLLVERQAMMRTLSSQEAKIVRWGSEAQVVGWAQREGLDRLGDSVPVRAR